MLDLQSVCADFCTVIASETFIFVDWSPSDPDSTTLVNLSLKLRFRTLNGYSRSFDLNTENSFSLMRILEATFNYTSKKVFLIGYDFKSLFSYYRRLCHKDLNLNNIIDLYWYESYRALDSSRGDLQHAMKNCSEFLRQSSLIDIYREYYKPLICKVLPEIESFGLLNDDSGKIVYSNYHLEGQENGRLSCSCAKKNTFNPHSLGEEKKFLLFQNTNYKYFLQFDYRNMEVSVLANIAKDEDLLEIVNSSDNHVYENIFERITGIKNHADAKNIGKKMFLPIIYGQSHTGLAKNLDISPEQAEIYYRNANRCFRKSFDFIEAEQSKAQKNGYLEDCYFRKRIFSDGEAYKGRNFIIQSPSALICLESLLKLYQGSENLFKIAFHVHDGYFLAIQKDCVEDAFYKAKNILESKLSLMPNLALKTSAKLGKSLDKMISLNKEKKV